LQHPQRVVFEWSLAKWASDFDAVVHCAYIGLLEADFVKDVAIFTRLHNEVGEVVVAIADVVMLMPRKVGPLGTERVKTDTTFF
jgi:hypothetical protein